MVSLVALHRTSEQMFEIECGKAIQEGQAWSVQVAFTGGIRTPAQDSCSYAALALAWWFRLQASGRGCMAENWGGLSLAFDLAFQSFISYIARLANERHADVCPWNRGAADGTRAYKRRQRRQFPLPGGLLAPEWLALLWLVERRAALHPALAPRRQWQTDLG